MKNFKILHLFAAAMLTLALSVSLNSSVEAKQWHDRGPVSGIYAFGDSLSDDGNFFALTGFPAEPYFQGRLSNGLVWVEYLAKALRLPPRSVKNYAYAGATTGRDNENDIPGFFEFPGLQDELDLFEAELDGQQADRRALYIVWAGANDFFLADPANPASAIAPAIGNTVVAVQRLHQAGARRIMVVNLPDLGLTPYGQSVNPAGLSFLSALYNNALDFALDDLEAAGVKTIRVDASGRLQDMVARPQRYLFSNVVDPYLPAVGSTDAPPYSSRGFLFWDPVHPSTQAHFVIAIDALRVLKQRLLHGG